MRWRPLRPGAKEPTAGKLPPDKFSLVIRQRRQWTAQERVRELPGFAGLEHRWCDGAMAFGLDQRWEALGEPVSVHPWPERQLVDALRAASSAAPDATAFAKLHDEPEALWVEAPLRDLLTVASTLLGTLEQGLAICFGGTGALNFVVGTEEIEVSLYGEWPHGVAEALTPTMPR